MDKKKILVNRAISRAKAGLCFILECLDHIHRGGTDAAFSRSIYILFSFNFELILKSRVILIRDGKTNEDLIKNLRHHDLEKISKELSNKDLNDINIKSIIKKYDTGFDEYNLETVDKRKVIIQDLVDVRYDFMKDFLRSSDPNESDRMKNEINILLDMIKKIEEMIK